MENPNLQISTCEEVDHLKKEIQELLPKLEKARNYAGEELCLYNGFWFHTKFFPSIVFSQKYFKTDGTHVILATQPKSGTTWLKALTFSILNRSDINQSPLLTSNPHALVPFLDIDLYQNLDIQNRGTPKVLATHLPYQLLHSSIIESDCRIIYICRNPLDHFISLWHFVVENGRKPVSLEEAFEKYCRGIHGFGPFWEHMEGYWDAHLKNPHKIMFLKYEDLKMDIHSHLKKIAEFVGCPFSLEEENEGLVERISKLCSFNSLKNLKVNKKGNMTSGYKYSSLFRKGDIGDYVNHLTPSMVERMQKLMELKLKGTAFMFNISSPT